MSLPTINKDAPIFKPAFEYQESTLQLPFGEFSIFSDLKANRVSPLEAMVTLTLCYRSNWSTGLTWRTSSRQLSDLIHLSHRYIRDALSKATAWIQRQAAPKGNTAGTFEDKTSPMRPRTRANGQRRPTVIFRRAARGRRHI